MAWRDVEIKISTIPNMETLINRQCYEYFKNYRNREFNTLRNCEIH